MSLLYKHLFHEFQTGDSFVPPPEGPFGNVWTDIGEGTTGTSWVSLGILLNILQCTGRPPSQQRMIWPQISTVLRNPGFKGKEAGSRLELWPPGTWLLEPPGSQGSC